MLWGSASRFDGEGELLSVLSRIQEALSADPDNSGVESRVTSVGQVTVGEMVRAGGSIQSIGAISASRLGHLNSNAQENAMQ
jgi:hypothetical protein